MKIIRTANFKKLSQANTLTYVDVDSDEEISIPAKWEICDNCQGSGGSSAYLGEISDESRMEMINEDDPGGDNQFETYMRGGMDKRCEDCKGTGKVLVPDENKVTPEQVESYYNWLHEIKSDWRDPGEIAWGA